MPFVMSLYLVPVMSLYLVLYLVPQTAPDGSFTAGNKLHVLSIAGDGTLTEPGGSPVLLPASQVPAFAHPQGLVVIHGVGASGTSASAKHRIGKNIKLAKKTRHA